MNTKPKKETFVVKESVATGHRRFLESIANKQKFTNLDAAKRFCVKIQKDDNQPFIEDSKGLVVFTGKQGKEHAEATIRD